jgi:Xaa-Pro aminopeptidase
MVNVTRFEHIKKLLAEQGSDYRALICRLPENVLMFTGYQPILGNSFCLVSLNHSDDVEIRLAIPLDEQDLIPLGVAVEVETFTEETLDFISTAIEAVRLPLARLLNSANVTNRAVIGYEGAHAPIATGYTQVGVPGPATFDLIHSLLLGDYLRDATPILDELAAIKTGEEIQAIRRAEDVAFQGFIAAREAIHVGATEADVAAHVSASLLRAGYATPHTRNVQPYVHVMTGPRAALAYRAFNLTSNAIIQLGDTVTVQMEIAINGYWAELTRTFFAASISGEWHKAHQACLMAQDAALKLIRDGAMARDVDRAARSLMEQAGFGAYFKHGLGHGFGFQAINHAAIPKLHPASNAVLRSGMVHNMEPAVYIAGLGGIRLNDNVVVLADGNEVLSSQLPRELDWLVVKA